MMRPEMVVEREPWTISHDASRTTAIVSSRTRAVLLRDGAARRALDRPESALELPMRRALAWDRDPTVLSDVAIAGAARWSTARALIDLVARAAAHAYVVCAREPAALVEGLLQARPAAPLTPVVIYGGRALIGPTFRDEPWPCRACWVRALCSNVPTLAERARRRHSIRVSAELDVGRVLAAARVLWEAPVARNPPDAALVIGLEDGTLDQQRLLPAPGCACASAPPGRLDDTVGDLIGRFTAVGDADPAAPLAIRTAVSRLVPHAQGGACALDPASARRRAIAEAAERFAASHAAERFERAAHRALSTAPPITALLPFSDAQYAAPAFRYARLQPSEEVDWIAGQDWQSGRTVHLPATLVTLDSPCSLHMAPRRSTGLAAGPSEPAAAIAGLLEVLERDVVTRSWYRDGAKAILPEHWAPFETRRLADAGLTVRLALCPNALRAPVAVAFVGAASGGALGCAASTTLAHAAIHAIEEAALMFSHRSQQRRLLPRRVAWPSLGDADRAAVRAHSAADLARIAAHYRPVIVSLSTRDTACMGVGVVRVWSARAVDFIGPGTPLPLRRWRPGASTRARIARSPDLFTAPETPPEVP